MAQSLVENQKKSKKFLGAVNMRVNMRLAMKMFQKQ